MHSTPQVRHTGRIWHISLGQIEATVSDFLGPGQMEGNSRKPTFSRHVSMYLARHVGGWSCAKISRFYNGRHHSTVLAAIRKIEGLRKQDESVDALLDMLTSALSPEMGLPPGPISQYSGRALMKLYWPASPPAHAPAAKRTIGIPISDERISTTRRGSRMNKRQERIRPQATDALLRSVTLRDRRGMLAVPGLLRDRA